MSDRAIEILERALKSHLHTERDALVREALAALKAEPVPTLPWVDIVERLPDEGPGRVLVIPRYGNDDQLGEPDTAPRELVREQPDLYAYWCEKSAIPLPATAEEQTP